MAEVTSAAVETGRSIGRYFAVISMVPSLLFVLYVYGLFAAGAWSGHVDPTHALSAAEDIGIKGVAALIVAALLLGLALHPLQFSMTRILEGYWGASTIGLSMAQYRIMHYRRLARACDRAADAADEAWQDAVKSERSKRPDIAQESEQERKVNDLMLLDSSRGDLLLTGYLRAEAARAGRNWFPEAGRRIMPTRLGNVLRRYEDKAGRQYGLNIIRVAPHLNLVAAKEHRDYVDDCRKGLDLSVRLCMLFALATALSLGILLDDGAWLLLTLVPYCISYLAYRGTISSAQAYGQALSTLVDLNRFALYDQLHVPPPSNTEDEKIRNAQLMKLLSGEPEYFLRYAPSSGAAPDKLA